MICPQFRPVVGGYERSAERLSEAVARQGIEVTVVTYRLKPEWPHRETAEGYEIVRLWCIPKRWFSTVSSVLSLSTYLLLHGSSFSIWHCHAPTAAVAVAIGWAKLFRKPVIVKLPSSGVNGLSSVLRRGLFGKLGFMRWQLHRANAIMVMTEAVGSEAKLFQFEADRIELLPNGVDTDRFAPTSSKVMSGIRSEFGIPPAALLVLQVCRFDTAKNLPRLIEAWAKLPPALATHARLAIVGDGLLLPEVRGHVAALGLEGQVILPGKRGDVECWYQAADLYVLSSLYEGLSNSLLEAMSCGLPVVATAVSGSELVNSEPPAGVVVPVDDAAALSKAIAHMVADVATLQEMGRNARRRIEDGFGIDSVARRTVELYEKLCCPLNETGRRP